MLRAAADSARYPCTANALRRSIRNSRIPLGANDLDVQILHKTGSLTGVAHDVALLECVEGRVWAAFLTEQQHDTLITGYAMGICTRHVLQAWGLAVQRTSSAVEG
ncbi:serine hydrolase [uncultured Lamprocystis sp.]